MASSLAASAPVGAQELAQFLGYRTGEERRYAVGPPSSLLAGEAYRWSIRPDRIEADAQGHNGVFVLRYERWEPGGLNRAPTLTRLMSAVVALNERAFPLRITLNERVWNDTINAEYSFVDNRCRKTVSLPDTTWEFDFPIARHANLDLQGGAGLYLFRQSTRPTDVLSHFGLLGLALPHPLPAPPWERNVLLFMPSGAIRWPDESWFRRRFSEWTGAGTRLVPCAGSMLTLARASCGEGKEG